MLDYLTELWLRLRLAHHTAALEINPTDARCRKVHNALNDLLRWQRHRSTRP